MKASIAIQILPQADSDKEVVRIVDRCIDVIASHGLHYEVAPFETTIEGDSIDELLDIAKQCIHTALAEGAGKVSAYIKTVCKETGDILSIDEKIGKYKN